MKYDAVINDIEREFYNHETRGNMLINTINKIMDPALHHDVSKIFIWSLDTTSEIRLKNLLSVKTPSLESKRNDILELLNMIVVQQRNLRFGKAKLSQAQNLAQELINEFSEEYHLKSL